MSDSTSGSNPLKTREATASLATLVVQASEWLAREDTQAGIRNLARKVEAFLDRLTLTVERAGQRYDAFVAKEKAHLLEKARSAPNGFHGGDREGLRSLGAPAEVLDRAKGAGRPRVERYQPPFQRGFELLRQFNLIMEKHPQASTEERRIAFENSRYRDRHIHSLVRGEIELALKRGELRRDVRELAYEQAMEALRVGSRPGMTGRTMRSVRKTFQRMGKLIAEEARDADDAASEGFPAMSAEQREGFPPMTRKELEDWMGTGELPSFVTKIKERNRQLFR